MIEKKRPDGRIELIKYSEGKYRSCIIDTISAPQTKLFKKINEGKLTSHAEWKDFGWEILNLYDSIKKLPDTLIVQILGPEGGGKTVGGKWLNPDENAWINADNKPLSFFGARQMYPEDNSKKNYSVKEEYDDILANVIALHAKRKGVFIVFILGHVETFKGIGELQHQRLAVLGKQATKLKIEGLNVFATYYTKILSSLPNNDSNRYRLETFSSGFNTVRTPEGYHTDLDIPNNYQIIVDKILEDYAELKPTS